MLTNAISCSSHSDGGHRGIALDKFALVVPRWTPETESRVVELLREGKPVREIMAFCAAKGLELKAHWVPQIAAKVGIDLQRGPRPGAGGRPRGENRQRAHDLRALGMSLRAIAAELGVSYQAVQDFLSDDKTPTG